MEYEIVISQEIPLPGRAPRKNPKNYFCLIRHIDIIIKRDSLMPVSYFESCHAETICFYVAIIQTQSVLKLTAYKTDQAPMVFWNLV